MTEQISVNESSQDSQDNDPEGKDWTAWTAAKVGIAVGTFIGMLFAIGYSGTSAWLCSGIRDCPTHPVPFIAAGAFVWVLTIIFITALSLFLHKLYRMFKVI